MTRRWHPGGRARGDHPGGSESGLRDFAPKNPTRVALVAQTTLGMHEWGAVHDQAAEQFPDLWDRPALRSLLRHHQSPDRRAEPGRDL